MTRYLQADCQEPGSASVPYAWQSSIGYLYLLKMKLAINRANADLCILFDKLTFLIIFYSTKCGRQANSVQN